MTKCTDRALGLLAGPSVMHLDKWINQHTIRACDFIYGTYERSSGRFWQMSFLANWFCCCPEACAVKGPLSRLQMDGKHEPNGCPCNFCMIGIQECKRSLWHHGNKDMEEVLINLELPFKESRLRTTAHLFVMHYPPLNYHFVFKFILRALLQPMTRYSASFMTPFYENPSAGKEENLVPSLDEKRPVFMHVRRLAHSHVADTLRRNHRTLSICHPHHGEETLDRLQCRLRNQSWSEWRTCPWSAAVHQSATCDASFLCLLITDSPPPHFL